MRHIVAILCCVFENLLARWHKHGRKCSAKLKLSSHYSMHEQCSRRNGNNLLLQLALFCNQRLQLWIHEVMRQTMYGQYSAVVSTSSEIFLQNGADARRILCAVAVLPVKLTAWVPGWAVSACPAFAPPPNTMFTTPAGKPAPSECTDAKASRPKCWPRPRIQCPLITELGGDYSVVKERVFLYCVRDSFLPTNQHVWGFTS